MAAESEEESSGYNPPENKEEFLDDIRAIDARTEGILDIPTYDLEGEFSIKQVYMRFDFENWHEVLEEAGTLSKRDLSKVLEDISNIGSQGGYITRELYEKQGQYNPDTVEHLLGMEDWESINRLVESGANQA